MLWSRLTVLFWKHGRQATSTNVFLLRSNLLFSHIVAALGQNGYGHSISVKFGKQRDLISES